MRLEQSMQIFVPPLHTVYAFIRKEGDQHCVRSHSGKNLGCYESAGGAKKRLKQVEYFKNVKAQNEQTSYGPDTGGMGPSEALGSPE